MINFHRYCGNAIWGGGDITRFAPYPLVWKWTISDEDCGDVSAFRSLLAGFIILRVMTLFDLLILLLVAGICGALGQAITGFSRGGCLVSIALGFIGALIGMWLARAMGLPELFAIQIGTTNFPIVWSIIGSALFVAVIALLTRRYY